MTSKPGFCIGSMDMDNRANIVYGPSFPGECFKDNVLAAELFELVYTMNSRQHCEI